MEDWKIRVERSSEEEIHRFLDMNPAKIRYFYYFDWDNNDHDEKEFYHISQYEEYLNEHNNKYPGSKLIKISDASIMVRKITEMELIELLRHDGEYEYNFEIKWNNQPFIHNEKFKTKQEFYSYKSEMQYDPKAEIIEIYQTRRTRF